MRTVEDNTALMVVELDRGASALGSHHAGIRESADKVRPAKLGSRGGAGEDFIENLLARLFDRDRGPDRWFDSNRTGFLSGVQRYDIALLCLVVAGGSISEAHRLARFRSLAPYRLQNMCAGVSLRLRRL